MNTFRNSFRLTILMAKKTSGQKNRSFFSHSIPMSSQYQLDRSEREAFHSVLPDVVDTIAAHPAVAEIPDLEAWLKKLFNHNLTGGKAARGQTVITAYEMLEKPDKITDDSMRLARVLGWCVEMAYVVILDDMMDASTTRRGRPCWYLMPDVGTSCAMNDAILVHKSMFYVMKKNFGYTANYANMLDIINETLLYTSCGQFLDLKTSSLSDKSYNLFTSERHLTIIKYKSAYYTYDLPIQLGFLLTGNHLDGKTRSQMQELSLDLGILFQIQDDYIDCYSDESISGKAGSDIQEGKCTWLAVNALQRCSDAQRIVFNACYGSKEPAHVDRIKRLYDQLQLPLLYSQVEGKYYDSILEKIRQLPTEELRRLFRRMLGITYQRKK